MKYTARVLLYLFVIVIASGPGFATLQKTADAWRSEFGVDKSDLAATGRNQYFILEPRYQLTFTGGNEKLVITVLDDTKVVDSVETRVVEERETKNDMLVEVSRNYFAISRRSNDVYYFGEEVDIYKNGNIVGHEGAWMSGKNGARFGLMMPAKVNVGDMYYQEFAPQIAMDRVRIVSTATTVITPAGTFKNCLRIEETTPLEPGVKEYKYYSAGLGLVQDGTLKLKKLPESR